MTSSKLNCSLHDFSEQVLHHDENKIPVSEAKDTKSVDLKAGEAGTNITISVTCDIQYTCKHSYVTAHT